MKIIGTGLLIQALFLTSISFADENAEQSKKEQDNKKIHTRYDDAMIISSLDDDFRLKAQIRLQFRASYPFETLPDFLFSDSKDDSLNLELNRARIKLSGHAYKKWLNYKLEYDINSGKVLSGFVTLRTRREANVLLGRFKVNYNLERYASSREYQLVERSVFSEYFGLDRQQGISVFGRFDRLMAADINYTIGVYTGTGISESNDDNNLMYAGRVQWNISGERIESGESDLKFRDKVASHLAFSAATNISPYTAFSSKGGIQIPGFEDGGEGQYKVEQWQTDAKLKYNGISARIEYHNKQIEDKYTNQITDMEGYLVGAGFFPGVYWDSVTKKLELSARYMTIDPDDNTDNDDVSEWTVGGKYYFNGYLHNLGFDFGEYEVKTEQGNRSDNRFRLQWEVNF